MKAWFLEEEDIILQLMTEKTRKCSYTYNNLSFMRGLGFFNTISCLYLY